MKYIFLPSILFFILSCSSKATVPTREQASESTKPFRTCPNDPEKQALRSQELQEIVKADQADRQIPPEKIDWTKVLPADEARAKRVAEIFAEGCFKTAQDYAAAALVFQHGVVPDHYYQAYLWSKKAVELGDEWQRMMVANAVDRYLINIGYKQIFAAQTFWKNPNGCRCLEPVETKFPDKVRVQWGGKTLKDRIAALRESNSEKPECQAVVYCEKDLKPTPKGMFPGIW